MDFSGLEAQVFIGVAVILGCAFVALLCDYLKGVNERLRERSLELTVRLEESERWRNQALATAQSVPAPASAPDDTSAGVMGELARLHREVERVSVTVASIAQLQSAVRLDDSAVRLDDSAFPMDEETGFDPQKEHDWAYGSHAEPAAQPPAFQPQRETVSDAGNYGVPDPSPEPLPEPAIEPVPELLEETPVLQPAVATSLPAPHLPPPQLAPDPAPVIIKPEITPALANVLRVPPRQAPATSLQELMVNVSQPREPRAEVRPEPSVATPPQALDIDVDIAEPARPNAVKIRVVRNETPPMLEPLAFEAAPVAAEPAPVARFEQPQRLETQVPAPMSVQVQAAATLAPSNPTLPANNPTLPAGNPGTGPELSLPSGMHDRATLDFLRADPAPFTGLVVAIGINDYAQLRESAGTEAAEDLLRSVGQLVKSITSNLSGAQHFAARAAEDEFVIVFNGEIGPAAQRRMAAVSERLWDFQLRSIGTFSVVFSWGAAEASEESFAEAVENASERMRETRQNRKSMGGEKSRKRVVA